MARHLKKIGDVFYYYRRIPKRVAAYDTRLFVKISLHTGDAAEAEKRAVQYNDYIENFWKDLIKSGVVDDRGAYKKAVEMARTFGFAYGTVRDIEAEPIRTLLDRAAVVAAIEDNAAAVAAVLGGVDRPPVLLAACTGIFWPLVGDRLIGKSPARVAKYKAPRERAMGDFIGVVGNKPLQEVSRKDVLAFREWWMERVVGGMQAGTANKQFGYVRDIIRTVAMAEEIDIDAMKLFADISMRAPERSRPPFTVTWVQDEILRPDRLAALNAEARWLIYMMADTGARDSEIVGLRPQDIVLDDDIPFIWIRPYEGHPLKTMQSARQIPLVGAALAAVRQNRAGITRYSTADSASALINRFMREKGMMESPRHTLYSLRHTFKDRLRDAEAPEEVIDELMGHKSRGPKYGRGHQMEKKLKYMAGMAFSLTGF